MLPIAVAVAAGLGAVLRYVVDQVVAHRVGAEVPWGTFVVNVTGSFLLGIVTGLAAHHGLDRTTTIVVGTGFAGGYTTLSTWAWESLVLAEAGLVRQVAANVVGSFAIGLAAAALGMGLAQL